MRRWICGLISGLALWLGFGLPVFAQGLLGTFHIDGQSSTLFSNDPAINQIDPSITGFQSNVNVPLVRDQQMPFGVDLVGRFGGSWLDGPSGTDQLKIHQSTYSFGANLYSNEWEGIRPWVGLGYLTVDSKQSLTSGGVTTVSRDSNDTLRFTLGAETILTERIAIRTSFDFTFEDMQLRELQSPKFVAEMINSPFDHFYFRVGGSVDFDRNIGILAGVGIKF